MRKIISLLLCSLLLWPTWAWSAIAVDAGVAGSGTGTSLTYGHTVSGSDRILVVGVTLYSDSTQTVSTVTYGGVSLTLISGCTAEQADIRTEQWYLIAPAAGTANVVVTLSATSGAIASTAVSFTGVDQSTPLGTCVTATGFNAAPTVAVSSAAGELVVDALAVFDGIGAAAPTVGASQTQRAYGEHGHAFGDFGAGASTEAGAGTVTMSWSLSGSRWWAIAATPLKEAAGGGGSTVRNLMLMGVGQ